MIYSENLTSYDCIIVGGGLAGLIAARALYEKGRRIVVVEAQDRIGGRVKTDSFQGFLLDHGFQVYLTAYPTAASELDLERLQLGTFESGALIRVDGRFCELSDPWRSPKAAWATLTAPVGSLSDKLRVGRLRSECLRTPSELLLQQASDRSTRQHLLDLGFSQRMIDRFFRAFFGGIFLDSSLEVSAAMFRYLFRIFSMGYASLPAGGMQAIPFQIAERIPPESIRTNSTALNVNARAVQLDDGTTLNARSVIVATEGPAASKLLSLPQPASFRSTVCFYFACQKPPTDRAILVLNGDETDQPVNSVAVLSHAQPSYGNAGQHLISVSCIGHTQDSMEALMTSVLKQMTDWYGSQVQDWKFLRSYSIPVSLPNQSPNTRTECQQVDGVILAGDHLRTGSIEGAIESGLNAAQTVLSK